MQTSSNPTYIYSEVHMDCFRPAFTPIIDKDTSFRQRHLKIRIQKHVDSQRHPDGAACSWSVRIHMSPIIFFDTYRKNDNSAHSVEDKRDAYSKIQTMNLQRAQDA